jgi:ankyrin repeat protein
LYQNIILALPTDDIQRGLKVDLQSRLRGRREVVKVLQEEQLSDDEAAFVRTFYGVIGYKCPKPWCKRFYTGFPDEASLTAHVLEHERPFQCPHDECFGNSIAFDTDELLAKYMKRFHEPFSSMIFPDAGESTQPILWKAAARGDLPAVKDLIARGSDINQPSRNKGVLTPLLNAVRNVHYHVCKFLLENGANIETLRKRSATDDGANILLTAIASNDVELVGLLCKYLKDASVFQAGFYHLDEVPGLDRDFLGFFSKGPVSGLSTVGRLDPVNLAAGLGLESILRELCLAHPFRPFGSPSDNKGSRGALHYACAMRGDVNTVRYLLTHMHSDDNDTRGEYGRTPLSYAVGRSHGNLGPDLAVVRQLIESQGDLNTLDTVARPLLCYAAAGEAVTVST